jgi:Zn-dependent protease with chaperone function
MDRTNGQTKGKGMKVLGRVLVGLVLLNCISMPRAWARFQPVMCKNAFTVEQEKIEGAKIAAQVYQQMPVLPDSDPVSRYVQQLGARLVAHAPGERWAYNFHVVAVGDVNAFALPGGSIFVNLGTVQAAETEAQLAGVIAHEVSHVVQRHSTCNITKAQTPQLGFGIASVLSSILLGDSALGAVAQGALGLGANATMMRMSRDAEKQADLLGVGILYDTGYDPRGMPQFFETIQAKYGAGGTQWLSDHPNPGNRMEYVNVEIATLPRLDHPIVTTPEFVRIHAIADGEQVYSAKDVQAGVWKRGGRYSSGPGEAVAVPVSNGQQPSSGQTSSGGQTNGTQPAAALTARLGRSAMGVGSPLVRFQGDRYVMSFPRSWQHGEDSSGAMAFVPAGGAGAGGLAYGAIVEIAQQPGDGVSDAAGLSAATIVLAHKLSDQNGGLQQVGQMVSTTINGQAVDVVELRGKSPVVEGGMQMAERDRLVTYQRADGDVSYIVFVAPERDLATIKPLFDEMMRSYQAQ